MHLEEMERENARDADSIRALKTAATHMWTGGEETVSAPRYYYGL